MRVVRAHDALRILARAAHHRKQALGRIVHQRDLAFLIGDDDRIGDRIDQQVQAVTFGTHLGLGRAQLGVVLVDLPRRHPEVGDVAQNRHDAGAFARITDERAEQLEEEIRSFRRIDQQELAAARLAFAERRPRQGGGKKHVVQLHRAPAAFTDIVRRGEQHFGPRVGDNQLTLHVREQDGVGRRVDDAEEQRVLASNAGVLLAEAGGGAAGGFKATAQRIRCPA